MTQFDALTRAEQLELIGTNIDSCIDVISFYGWYPVLGNNYTIVGFVNAVDGTDTIGHAKYQRNSDGEPVHGPRDCFVAANNY